MGLTANYTLQKRVTWRQINISDWKWVNDSKLIEINRILMACGTVSTSLIWGGGEPLKKIGLNFPNLIKV